MNEMFSREAETSLLGTMLLDEAEIDAVDDLDASDLYLDSNRTILTTIRSMRSKGQSVDLTTLMEELNRTGKLQSVGGLGYLSELTTLLSRRSKTKPYARIIREKAQLRTIVNFCDGIAERAQNGDDSSDLLHDLQASAIAYQASGAQVKSTPIAELVVTEWENMKIQRKATGAVLGITTGIDALDRVLSGWRNGELTYVGALPGRGKTSFLLQAMYAAAMSGAGVGCISLEMRSGQLIRRLAIQHSGLHAHKFRDVRTMNDTEFQAAKQAVFSLGDLPIDICDQSGLKPGQIAALARQMHARGAKVIFVDFVQIIVEDGRERREAINRVSAALRDTCKSLEIPFVVASQLARRDSDPNRRPTIQDLRESGNLEQDAHNVILLYRPKDKGTSEWTGEDQIIVDKQREGLTGSIDVKYDDHTLTYIGRQ